MESLGWTALVLSLIALGLWIYAILDIVRGSLDGSGNKILWLIVVIFFPILGALLYLLMGKKS